MATAEDLEAIADLVRGTDVMVFSDEPYCHMVWEGRHHSILAEPGMIEHTVAAYTFSKSYSMSGWRIGFAVAHPDGGNAIGKLINTTASCSPPLAQWAAQAALENDAATRDDYMQRFRGKVELLCDGLKSVEGLAVTRPAGTFYVFPDARPVCNRLGITSHGLALYLLEGADDTFGVACLGGECFGEAGRGFLRFSCAEPDERIAQAIAFIPDALSRIDRLRRICRSIPSSCSASPISWDEPAWRGNQNPRSSPSPAARRRPSGLLVECLCSWRQIPLLSLSFHPGRGRGVSCLCQPD